MSHNKNVFKEQVKTVTEVNFHRRSGRYIPGTRAKH